MSLFDFLLNEDMRELFLESFSLLRIYRAEIWCVFKRKVEKSACGFMMWQISNNRTSAP